MIFLCFRAREYFPSMEIGELFYADNFMFTGQRSDSGSYFFKIVKAITLYLVPVSILCETGTPLEGRCIHQSEFSFLIWLIYTRF